ncbi:DUF5677 domain-containing protein [Roseateles paludis]|jgi:hypothetical protein|uniref:DUF5677 domain-containing protein n=1 Tax=Roseateles paludis TaxID=3145238 RepID=A0ABV0G1M4_9BURK
MTQALTDEMFLDDWIHLATAGIRLKHMSTIGLCRELNVCANRLIFSTTIRSSDIQQVLIAALLPRLLTAFQGAVLTGQIGLASEAKLLVRKVLEVTFRIVAVSKSVEVANRYVQSDECHRRKFLNKLSALKSVELSALEMEQVTRLKQEVNDAIAEKGIREIGTQWFAEQAELMDLYNTAYALLSEAAHANVRDIGEVLIQADASDVDHLRYGPDDDGLSDVPCTAIEATLISLEAAFQTLPIVDSMCLQQVRRRMTLLFEVVGGAD